jgi:aryl-alcohol dehydrogenase-like predicted oxidoreductase
MTSLSTASRREFLRATLVLGAAATALRSAEGLLGAAGTPGQLPKIKLGQLEVSRLILGSNPFFGFSHGNPQASAQEMKAYYTDDQIMAVLDAAADQGITAVWTPCYPQWIRLWNQYQERGGKLKIWIGQPDASADQMKAHISAAAKNGAKAVCIQGIQVDTQMEAGKLGVLREWLELIKSFGLPAGMATHRAKTHLLAEEKGLPTDFYHQTLYRPDTYVREGLEESLATIEKIDKPVVAYKVLGAGRLQPKETLPYVFKRLRKKDGVCIGAFPKKKNELAENAALTRQLSGNGAA